MCRVISVSNQKGGVAKSSCAFNLGIGLARQGKKVLIVDLDPQGSLTASMGYQEPDEITFTIADIMMAIINEEEINPGDGILHHEENVDLMPGNIELYGLEITLGNVMSREMILKEYIEMMREYYQYIILDCMPSLGMLTINVLVATDSVLIPVQAAYLPVKGLQQLIRTISMVKKRLNRRLKIPVVDHIIVGRGQEYYSFKDKDVLPVSRLYLSNNLDDIQLGKVAEGAAEYQGITAGNNRTLPLPVQGNDIKHMYLSIRKHNEWIKKHWSNWMEKM